MSDGSSDLHKHFDMLLFILDQLSDTIFNDALQRNLTRDHIGGFDVSCFRLLLVVLLPSINITLRSDELLKTKTKLTIPKSFNHILEILLYITQTSDILPLPEDQIVRLERNRLFPDRNVDNSALNLNRLTSGSESHGHARTIKHNIDTLTTRQGLRCLHNIVLPRIENDIRAKMRIELLTFG